MFASFQESDRGIITISQLADIVELLGDPRPDISVLRALLQKISDEDESSSTRVIDFKKFLRFFVCHLYGGHLPVRSREIFSAFDCDTNASVSAVELQESLTSMGMSLNAEEALAMTYVADGSIEGEVNYHEFKQICRRIDSEISHRPSARVKNNATSKKSIGRVNAWMRSPLTSPECSPRAERVSQMRDEDSAGSQ